MKTYFPIFAIIIAIAAWGCKQKAPSVNYNKPEAVANAFMKAMSKMDFEGSKRLVTKETLPMLELMSGMMKMLGGLEKKALDEQMKNVSFDPTRTKCTLLDPETAKCSTCCDAAGNSTEEGTTLKKVEGKWLIHMSKESILEQMNKDKGNKEEENGTGM